MDKTLIAVISGCLLMIAAFVTGRLTKDCPEVDPLLIKAYEQQAAEKDEEIKQWRYLSDKHKAEVDSLEAIPQKNVDQVLPRSPLGNTDASVDSLRTRIILNRRKVATTPQ